VTNDITLRAPRPRQECVLALIYSSSWLTTRRSLRDGGGLGNNRAIRAFLQVMRFLLCPLGLAATLMALWLGRAESGERPVAAPPFPTPDRSHWIGEPQTWEALRGRVVLLDVWTFECINCVRTIPWIRDVLGRYGSRGFSVVGVHTPEMESERVRASVEAEVRRHQLAFSHLLDNDHAYWKALGNHYWPALYLVDRCGRIRATAIGEVHAGQQSGQRLEGAVEALLEESTADCAQD
jgi:thiol-disulfide isomerase/thioredoxin